MATELFVKLETGIKIGLRDSADEAPTDGWKLPFERFARWYHEKRSAIIIDLLAVLHIEAV